MLSVPPLIKKVLNQLSKSRDSHCAISLNGKHDKAPKKAMSMTLFQQSTSWKKGPYRSLLYTTCPRRKPLRTRTRPGLCQYFRMLTAAFIIFQCNLYIKPARLKTIGNERLLLAQLWRDNYVMQPFRAVIAASITPNLWLRPNLLQKNSSYTSKSALYVNKLRSANSLRVTRLQTFRAVCKKKPSNNSK